MSQCGDALIGYSAPSVAIGALVCWQDMVQFQLTLAGILERLKSTHCRSQRLDSDSSQQLEHTSPNTSVIDGEAMNGANYSNYPEGASQGSPKVGNIEFRKHWMEWSPLETAGGQQVWAISRNLPSVFTHYMCTAILKIGGMAAIKISFPTDPAKSCIVFDISATEVHHIAKELFGVHINNGHKRRRLIFRDGRTLDMYTGGKFRGGEPSGIDEIIGTTIGTAFRTCQPRIEELSNGELLSNSMSIRIWSGLDSPARIKIRAEPEQLWQIGQALWNFLPD